MTYLSVSKLGLHWLRWLASVRCQAVIWINADLLTGTLESNITDNACLLCSIWGCVYSAYPFILMVVRMRVLYLIIIIIGPICHCLGFGHETMVCDVCLSLFLLKYISGYHTHNYWQTATEWQQQHSQCHNKSTSRMDNGMITMNNEAIN